jgi:competence protein ComEC
VLPSHRRPHTARLSPLVAALGALVLGILGASWLMGVPAPLLLLAMGLCLGAAPLLRARPGPLAAALLLPVALFGAVRARDAAEPPPSDVSRLAGGPSVWVRGTVTDEPEPTAAPGALRYALAAAAVDDGRERRSVTGLLYVTQRTNAGPAPEVGDTVRVRGRIEHPEPATNPGGLEFAAYLARRGVFATLNAKRTGDAERVSVASSAPSPARAAGALRAALTGAASRALPPDDAALLNGLLLSARSRLPADLSDAFARTGTVHVLSTSGLHLAALAGVLAWSLRLLPASRGVRVAGALGGAALIWLYALAAGAGPAAVRAALMTTVLLLAPLLRRDTDPLHSLAFAAFVILARSPLALYDAGTQLSFSTVGFLMLWMPALERLWLPWEPGMRGPSKAARWVCLAVLGGVVAHLASWPLVAWHFGVVSLVAPAANLLVVPLSEVLLLLGLGAAGAGAVLPPTLSAPLLAPCWALLHALLAGLRWLALAFAAPSWAAVSCAPPPAWLLALYYGLLGGAAPFVRRHALVRTLFVAPREDRDAT